jgi:hypothetical protein
MINFSIPANDEYTAMLGRTIYNFTYYEWAVVWTIEKIQPGYLQWYSEEGPTAGRVAKKFADVIGGLDARLGPCATDFDRLRVERDKLLHAHPYTSADGVQQLGYQGRHPSTEWPFAEVEDAARKFDAAACELIGLFYQLWPST